MKHSINGHCTAQTGSFACLFGCSLLARPLRLGSQRVGSPCGVVSLIQLTIRSYTVIITGTRCHTTTDRPRILATGLHHTTQRFSALVAVKKLLYSEFLYITRQNTTQHKRYNPQPPTPQITPPPPPPPPTTTNKQTKNTDSDRRD